MIDSETLIADLAVFAGLRRASPKRFAGREVRAPRAGDRRTSVLLRCLLLLVALVAAQGCGKKGPPLAPLPKVPAAPQDVAVRRTGDAATMQLRIPAANNDGTRPASLERVDVYGFTGKVPTPVEVVKYGTLVVSIPVRRPPAEDERAGGGQAAGTGKPRPPASMANGFDQGDLITATEALGPAQSSPVEVKRRGKQPVQTAGEEWQPLLQPAAKAGTVRQFFAVGVNRKGQRGPFTPAQPVPLGPAPSAPKDLKVDYDATGIHVTWAAPPDVPKPVQAPAAEGELASTPRGVRSPTGGYNVYPRSPAESGSSRIPPASPRPPVQPGGLPKPLNDKLLEVPSFTDPQLQFGTQRCFEVRTVRQSGADVVESDASEAACVTPADRFPPQAPGGLAAVASEGAISLIWEASPDADLAGYVVWRRDPAGGQVALTPEPITETTFRDATASRGVRYVYTVVAVDTAGNRSEPSNAVQETAR